MIDYRTAWKDPRRRNLAILAGVAAVTVLLAIFGLTHEARLTAGHDSPRPFFPDLASNDAHIAHVRIVAKGRTIDVVFRPERGWVVASHDDYPASFEELRETVAGMTGLTTLEEKTARPDWLRNLGLAAPEEGGNGTEIVLLDDKGHVLASLIAGKTVDIGDSEGAVGLFVRRPGDSQSWLARSFFEPKSDPGDWLAKQVMSIDRARIAEADIDPASGPSYVVRRDKPSDADFKLTAIPQGRELSYDSAPDGVAAAVVDFSFDDVKPAKIFDFSDPAHISRVVTKTFDGLTIAVNVVQQGADYWADVSAEGANPDAQKEARDIDAHASGWAYKLPAVKGAQFTTALESLLKPKAGAAAPAAQ